MAVGVAASVAPGLWTFGREQIMRLCVCRLLCEDNHVSVQSAMELGNVRGPWVIQHDRVHVLEARQPKEGKDMGRFSPFNHIKLDH